MQSTFLQTRPPPPPKNKNIAIHSKCYEIWYNASFVNYR